MDKDYIENVRANHLTVLKEGVQLKSTLKQKDSKIAELETKNIKVSIELKSKTDQLKVAEDKVQTLETELSKLQLEISDSKEKLKQANKDVDAMKLLMEQKDKTP